MKNSIKTWCLCTQFLSLPLLAEEAYSPYANNNFPENVYFGDTHLHTNLSVDANGMGNKVLSPDDAYNFAKGASVTMHNGQTVRLSRPLDFLVVSDHALNMGVMRGLSRKDPLLLNTEFGQRWLKISEGKLMNTKTILGAKTQKDYDKKLSRFGHGAEAGFFWNSWLKDDVIEDVPFRQTIWSEVTANAERHNAPGHFTAFVGYEWTSPGQAPANLHRVVIFKDGKTRADKVLPFSTHDSLDPEKLWAYLQGYERQTGGEVMAIPHNSNVSSGEMFALQDFEGKPLSKAYAQTRSRWEPLLEVTQVKGDSETHPLLSPDDEFADYETWNSWAGRKSEGIKWRGKDIGGEGQKDWIEAKQKEYARSALKLGLAQQAKLGVNPFKFGMIGSTDSHTALSTAAEDNYMGKFSVEEPTPYRTDDGAWWGWQYVASGYAAVWAEENTRESLFAAMKRRETYATTGPRMTVRFFGGWGYEQDDANRPDLAKIGYAGGVPMGGDLTTAPKGKAPNFLIRAVKDPDGANLDRVQVIKGWRGMDGKLREKVYNVALSDGRKDKGKRTRPVGNTVNVKEARYTNTIGDTELSTVWTDPDFNADELAFYYVRVIQIPTPRWTAYDAKYFGTDNMPKKAEMITQDRAYTSPIWYTP